MNHTEEYYGGTGPSVPCGTHRGPPGGLVGLPGGSVVVREVGGIGKHYGEFIGYCKWFNKSMGYGFLTVMDERCPHNGNEIFVHHSAIRPLRSQYRTLRKGEYVSFDMTAHSHGGHFGNSKGPQAVNVTGVHGGPLMCDASANAEPNA